MTAGPDFLTWLRRYGPAGPDAPLPFVALEGRGIELEDGEGRKFLDFARGAELPLGYNHPAVAAALASAGARGGAEGIEWPEGASLAHKLAELAPGGMNRRVLACDSGREALARAIALARQQTKRDRVVYLSETGAGKLDIGAGAAALVCHPFDPRLKQAAELCRNTGALLVDDETGIGPGMTGRMFAVEWEEVRPDIYVLGRGWAAGLPFGACITGSSTLAWGRRPASNPAGCAAALALIRLLEQGLLEQSAATGSRIEERLQALGRLDKAGAGTGRGLVWTMVFPQGTDTAAALLAMCRERGLLLRDAGEGAVGFRPALVAAGAEVDRAFDVIEQVLVELGRKKR